MGNDRKKVGDWMEYSIVEECNVIVFCRTEEFSRIFLFLLYSMRSTDRIPDGVSFGSYLEE